MLTEYDGRTLTYDEIGNPLSFGDWTYTWKQGRQLASMSNPYEIWTFTYDANGMRATRSDGTTTYEYVYNGSQLVQLTVGETVLSFTYDANGIPQTITENGEVYHYITNQQRDVVAIRNETGALLVSYTYDAWGKVLTIGGPFEASLGFVNPLRYRGYVYDHETGLYYLQSRYYNPETGRFLNADGMIAGATGDLMGYNQFAYCFNNPTNMGDSAGNWPKWIKSVVQFVKKAVDISVQTAVVAADPIGRSMAVVAHYNRNILNNDDYTEQELLDNEYEAEGPDKDKFHQNNQLNNKRNRKYVIGEWGSSEIVYYYDGTVNNTPEDRGTFNVYSGDNDFLNFAVHGLFDVVPYVVWGNSVDDSTTIVDRFIVIFGGQP